MGDDYVDIKLYYCVHTPVPDMGMAHPEVGIFLLLWFI